MAAAGAAIFTIPADLPQAETAARWMLEHYTPEQLPRALLLLPTRRACGVMRDAFLAVAKGQTLLLPRMVPLAELGGQFPLLQADLLPAMDPWQQLALMMQQVYAFEAAQHHALGFSQTQTAPRPSLKHALTLAEAVIELQEECLRAGVDFTPESLDRLAPHLPLYAEHWQRSTAFLRIIAEVWPLMEAELGMVTASAREVALTQRIIAHWRAHPPTDPVIALGSTASQTTTSDLLACIAQLPSGVVIVPAWEADAPPTDAAMDPLHPLHSIARFLARFEGNLPPILPLKSSKNAQKILLLEALCATESVAEWESLPPLPPDAYAQLRLIPCDHGEEEARVVALLLREALERPACRAALITPEEGFMNQVAAHLRRYGITANRLSAGRLAATEQGNLWVCALEALRAPQQMAPQLALLHHPLVRPDAEGWKSWLIEAEPAFRGVVRQGIGQLPRLKDTLAMAPEAGIVAAWLSGAAGLARQRLNVNDWIEKISELLTPLAPEAGEGADAVAEMLDGVRHCEGMGAISLTDFADLVTHGLTAPWRGGLYDAHPQIHLLTPVEARLQPFDRVILARMQEGVFPRRAPPNPWLNLAQQRMLGLPDPAEQIGRMAHDLLVLGSAPELFLTYARRDGGSPTTRSRFVERLVARLEAQGVREEAITAPHYRVWAAAQDAPEGYRPAPPPRPVLMAEERPTRMAISRLDALFSDPYAIYAEYVLGLKPLDGADELPSAKDFGTIAHKALEALTLHWNEHTRPATEQECERLTSAALRQFSDQPAIQIFWSKRLHAALDFVNEAEALRRTALASVRSEEPMEARLPFGEAWLTLIGRIDRWETRQNGQERIVDYKTGDPATVKEVAEGRAVQLLAYTMLLQAQGKSVEALEYWGLPHGTRSEKQVEITEENLKQPLHALVDQLRTAITQMLAKGTPFLARPMEDSHAEPLPYDGVSRYDEWAG